MEFIRKLLAPRDEGPRSLLIACGRSRVKQVQLGERAEWTGVLTTMDMNPNCGADIVFDMDKVANGGRMPFPDDTFDEMGCYNAMEHWGRQGDWRGWFHECGEYWRILKPGGVFSILVPIGKDMFADPGHTRFFSVNHFGFLNQAFYSHNSVEKTCFTDYRWYWKKNFDVVHFSEHGDHHLAVILRKA